MNSYIITGFADEIDESMQKQYALLKKLGINHIELRGVNGKNVSKLTLDEARALKKELDAGGFSISAIGSPIGKIKITDDFSEHFESFKHTVEIAKIVGTRYIRMFSFYVEGDYEGAKAEVYSRLRAFIDYAKTQDIVLLHENEKGIYGDTDDRCLELMQELYCDNFKMTFDFANFVQCGCDTVSAFDKLFEFVEYIHIKDAVSDSGENVPAGTGEGNIPLLLKKAFDNGYSGFLSLEPHLFNFKGLADLETEEIADKKMSSGETAFTVAFEALRKILKNIEG